MGGCVLRVISLAYLVVIAFAAGAVNASETASGSAPPDSSGQEGEGPLRNPSGEFLSRSGGDVVSESTEEPSTGIAAGPHDEGAAQQVDYGEVPPEAAEVGAATAQPDSPKGGEGHTQAAEQGEGGRDSEALLPQSGRGAHQSQVDRRSDPVFRAEVVVRRQKTSAGGDEYVRLRGLKTMVVGAALGLLGHPFLASVAGLLGAYRFVDSLDERIQKRKVADRKVRRRIEREKEERNGQQAVGGAVNGEGGDAVPQQRAAHVVTVEPSPDLKVNGYVVYP